MFDLTFMDHKDRDNYLHQLYGDRNYYEFFYGKEWFDSQINKIWEQWLKYEPKSRIIFGHEFPNSIEWHRGCWEIDHDII